MPIASPSEAVPPSSGEDPQLKRALARVGTVLRGKWRLDALLGVGGMAAVFAATHRNGTRAAVKILHTELSADDGLRKRFFREGRIANTVGHDGAVRVVDDDVAEDGSLFLVTELLEGESLEDRRVRCGGTLTEDDVLPIADQVLDVLAAAHAKGVVHRDLKPENIFLTRTGQVKVLDFGIARALGESKNTQGTKAGTVLGTPPFMAPEQARGLWDEVDGRADLWALGSTLFRLLSGAYVHEGRSPNEELLSAMTQPAPPLASRAPGVSPAVAALVDRALAFDKADRWPDAGAMQQAIHAAYVERYKQPIPNAPKPIVPSLAIQIRAVTPAGERFDAAKGQLSPASPTLASSDDGPPAHAHATTGAPISRSTGRAAAARRAWRNRRWVWVAAAAAASAATVCIFVVARRAAAPSSAPSIAPGPTSSVPSVAPVATAASTVAEATAEASTQGPPPVASAISSAAPSNAGRTPRPRVAPRTSAPSRSPQANCNPPFVIDANGIERFKPECL